MNVFRHLPVLVLCVALFGGCTSTGELPDSSDVTGRWNFPVVGKLESISVADLSTVVRLVSPRPVYRLVVVSVNEVQVQLTKTRRGSSVWLIVKRVHGRWQITEPDFVIIS